MIRFFDISVATPTVLTTFCRKKTRKTHKCKTEEAGRQPVRFHAWYDDGNLGHPKTSIFTAFPTHLWGFLFFSKYCSPTWSARAPEMKLPCHVLQPPSMRTPKLYDERHEGPKVIWRTSVTDIKVIWRTSRTHYWTIQTFWRIVVCSLLSERGAADNSKTRLKMWTQLHSLFFRYCPNEARRTIAKFDSKRGNIKNTCSSFSKCQIPS